MPDVPGYAGREVHAYYGTSVRQDTSRQSAGRCQSPTLKQLWPGGSASREASLELKLSRPFST